MALYQFLCGVTLLVLLTSDGCLSREPTCGVLPEGKNADDPLPWQAFLTLDGARQCLVTVISSQWLLTDGFCGYGPDDNAAVVLAGDADEEPLKVELYKCTHNSLIIGGLCLLKLADPLKFSDYVSPICMAAEGSMFYTGKRSYISTGSCDEPTEDVPIVGYNECKCKLPSLEEGMICAGEKGEKAESNKCQKNIGGALMTKSHESWMMVGVSRYDPECMTPDSFKAYTRVSDFQEWIEEVTADSPAYFNKCKPEGVDSDKYFVCPTKCDKPPPPKCDYPSECYALSIFDGGVSIVPSLPFVLLCALALSLYAVRW